jgi:hypothetical protein
MWYLLVPSGRRLAKGAMMKRLRSRRVRGLAGLGAMIEPIRRADGKLAAATPTTSRGLNSTSAAVGSNWVSCAP